MWVVMSIQLYENRSGYDTERCYRDQSIDLPYKLVDWFLYDKDLRHERVKRLNSRESESRINSTNQPTFSS